MGPPKAVQELILSHHLSDNIEDTTTLASDVHSKENIKYLTPPWTPRDYTNFNYFFASLRQTLKGGGKSERRTNVESTHMKFALESGKE